MIDIKSQIIKPALGLEDMRVVASAEGWGLTDIRSLGFFNKRNFRYRRVITITEQSGSSLIDYQVLIELNSTNFNFSHTRSDGGDIRFTDTAGNLLPYWIESYDASAQTAKIFVKVPSLPANATIVIYMYYGNSSVFSESDGEATFEFFDDEFSSLFTPLENADTYQTTPTYDGSGQSIHPDVLFFPNGWNGYKYWMVMSPFPNGNDDYENPSILASSDGSSWVVPSGLINPIDPTPTNGHNCDTDMIYNDETDELWVYYLEAGAGTSYLKRRRSSDGVNWEDEEDIFNLPDYQILSPAIVKVDSTYYMWYVDSGSAGCSATSTTIKYRTSSDGINWSSAQDVNISQPNYVVWHLDVIYVPSKSEYWMLIAAYPSGSNCGNTVLFYAKSTDRINWTTYNKKALGKGSGWDGDQIYRSTLLYDNTNDLLRVWYSGKGTSGYRVGYTERNYTTFLDILTSAEKWKEYDSGGSYSIADSKITLSPTQNASNAVALRSSSTFTNGIILEAKVDPSSDTYYDLGLITSSNIFTNTWHIYEEDNIGYAFIAQEVSGSKYGYRLFRRDTGTKVEISGFAGNGQTIQPIIYKLAYTHAGELKGSVFFLDGTEWVSISVTDTTYLSNNKYVVIWQGEYSSGLGGPSDWDWVRVRKYADPEPSVSIGSENVRITFSSNPEGASIEVIK